MSERLNEWAVFSEKNKELCEWLTQMEGKVSQNGDILIEEMIEKLKKVSAVSGVRQGEQGDVAWGSLLPSASLSSLSLPCRYVLSPVFITCEKGTWERPTLHAKSTGCV